MIHTGLEGETRKFCVVGRERGICSGIRGPLVAKRAICVRRNLFCADKHFQTPKLSALFAAPSLHVLNGAAMKAAETLGLLAVRGVEFSHSRPRVSNDNPYSELLFKTMKYTGHMGKRNYHSLEECKKGLAAFAQKYNEQWVHSGINNVTPWARFSGADAAICEARRVMLEKARQQHPERWIGGRVMRCEAAGSQWLNPDRQITSLKGAA